MSLSPSHHRDLSRVEKEQFGVIIDDVEIALGKTSSYDEVKVAPVAAVVDVERAARGLGRIYDGLLADLSACSAIIKTTRIVAVLGRAISTPTTPPSGASAPGASLSGGLHHVAARILRLLVEQTHSRRAYSTIMQAHAAAFERLVHVEDTAEDASALLCHVLHYAQDAADVRQSLLAHGLMGHLRERLCAGGGSSTLDAWGVRILHAIAASTPPVSSDVLVPLQDVLREVLAPLLIAAPQVADICGAMAPDAAAAFRRRIDASEAYFGDACDLVATIGLEFPATEAVCRVGAELAGVARMKGLVQHAGFLEACVGNAESAYFPIVQALLQELRIIRKQNLDTQAVQQALTSLHNAVAQGQRMQLDGVPMLAFAFAHFPAAIKTLCGTLASVDERTSSLSCVILTAVTSSALPGPTEQSSRFTFSVVDQFVLLDGVLLLADMLIDYSEDVLGGAFGLLRTLSGNATAEQHVVQCGALRRVAILVEQLSERVESVGDGCRGSLLVTMALCLDFSSRLPSAAITEYMLPVGKTIANFCHYVTVKKTTTLSVLAQPALRLVAALAAVDASFPMLLSEEMWQSTIAAHCPPSTDQSSNIIAAMLGAISPCLASCPSLAGAWAASISSIGTAILQAGATSLYTRLWSLVADAGQTPSMLEYQRVFADPILFMLSAPEQFERHLAATLNVASVLKIPSLSDDAFCTVGKIALSEHAFSEDVRTAAVECLCSTQNPLLPSTLVRIILMCEDATTDDASLLANLCFHGLIHSEALAVGELSRIGTVALDVAFGNAGRSSESLGWLQPITDSDDAHDTLVAIVPLLNGILHHSGACRTAAGSAGTTVFFLRLLSAGQMLEVPLKVLSLYGLWHVLNGEPPTGESQAQCMVTSTNVFLMLGALLDEAAAVHQTPDALCEIRHAVYLLAERLLLMLRNLTEMTVQSQVLDFVQQRVLLDVRESQACELLLLVLQEDEIRFQLKLRCPAEYATALHVIHAEALPHREHQSFQYLLMQIEKYIGELS